MNREAGYTNANATGPSSEDRRELALVCLGVIVPVFNEAATVDELLRRVLAQPCVQEVVGVDDASTDGTGERLGVWPARDARVQVLRHPVNRGKGAAIRSGFARVSAPVVIIQDADLEYDPADYERLLGPIRRQEADVVYGSRFAPGTRPVSAWWHTGGNRLLTAFTNVITGLRLTDEATCYKVFRREVLARLTLREERFGFCPEVTVKLSRRGVRILEVPIHYAARSRAQGKKLRWRDGLVALGCLLRYTLRP